MARKIKGFFLEEGLDPFPIRHTLKGYQRGELASDSRAALNVVLLALPQGMAYAAIANLPILFGIVCSAVAGIVAPIFASSRYVILGPTNATALMVFTTISGLSYLDQSARLGLMPLLVLLVGLVCLVGAVLRVADLLQYISHSVLVGYITGAAFLIATSQMKHLLGVSEDFGSNGTFVGMVDALLQRTADFEWSLFAFGLGTLFLYYLLRKVRPSWPSFALVLVLSSAAAHLLSLQSPSFAASLRYFEPFTLSDLSPRTPELLPEGFFHTISLLLGPAFAIAFLASLENSVMSKSLAARTGGRSRVNQDMLGVGMANLACACTASMPASGSLTRSALNFEAGAKTPVSSFLAGLLCILGALALAFFPDVLGLENPVSKIPKVTLSALVIAIATSLINWGNIRVCLRSTPGDAFVYLVTFAAALVTHLDTAIFIGVGLSITLFLRKASKPYLVEYEMSDEGEFRELEQKQTRSNPSISIVHVEGDLFFGAADLFRTQVQRLVDDPNLKVIILRLKNARHLDATSVVALRDLIKFVRKSGRHLIISGSTREVYKVLKNSGVLEALQEGCNRLEGESNLFFYAPSNPNISTRDALLRAQQLMGSKTADVKIFYDPSHKS